MSLRLQLVGPIPDDTTAVRQLSRLELAMETLRRVLVALEDQAPD